MTQKRIYLYLHPTSSVQLSWSIFDEAGKKIASIQNGDVTEFPKDSEKYQILLFVPTEPILLQQVALPKLSYQRLMQALPFALEEQLIQDVDDLHFAVSDYQADNTWPVAIVSKAKMSAWLALCGELNIKPFAIVPSVFMLPYIANTLQVNTDQQHCLVRFGLYSGFACEKENLSLLLELKKEEIPDQEQKEIIHTETSEFTLLEKAPEVFATKPEINLLQGIYQPKQEKTQTKKIWAITGYLSLALIALGLFSQAMSLFILNREATRLDLAIATIYKKNFPNAKSIVAPRERLTEKLRNTSGLSNKQSLFVLLGQIGKTIAETKNVRIQHLEFHDPLLTVDIKTQDFANLDHFTSLLKQANLTVKQQNAAAEGSEVKATLLIQASHTAV